MRKYIIVYEDEKDMYGFGSLKKLCLIMNLNYRTIMTNLSKKNIYIKDNYKIRRITFD